jgi:hypothetical protein
MHPAQHERVERRVVAVCRLALGIIGGWAYKRAKARAKAADKN